MVETIPTEADTFMTGVDHSGIGIGEMLAAGNRNEFNLISPAYGIK